MRKFSPRLAEHFEAAPDRKTRHDAGDKQVRPCLLGAEYAQRRTENCNVTDGIVARTDPHRAHVRIAFAIAEQQQHDDAVPDKRQRADPAHRMRPEVRPCNTATDTLTDHTKAKARKYIKERKSV